MKTRTLFSGFYVILLCCFLYSCTKEGAVSNEQTEALFKTKSSELALTQSQQDATIKKAFRFLEVMNNDAQKKNPAAVRKTIKGYSVIPTKVKASTKEGDYVSLSVAHLSEDKEGKTGYMLMVNDERIPEVLAFSDQGDWDLSKQPQLEKFISETMDAYIDAKIKSQVKTKTEVDDCEYEIIDSYNSITGKDCSSRVTWKQTGVIADSLPHASCWQHDRDVAGCIAVALGHIMAYHEWPVSGSYIRHGRTVTATYNWTKMKARPDPYYLRYVWPEAESQVANLIAEVGYKAPLTYECDNQSWDCNSTSGNIDKAKNALSLMGYTGSTIMNGAPFSKILSNIEANKPVYMQGETAYSGHAWSIEGYKQYISWELIERRCPNNAPERIETNASSEYIYCNWGEGGAGNGYYLWRPFYTPTYNPSGYPNPTYDRALKFIVNITPNRI